MAGTEFWHCQKQIAKVEPLRSQTKRRKNSSN
nr:MAG TPA: hypothetical protein [Caudoviricetes sp.]